jgi:MoxR-like ATPase
MNTLSSQMQKLLNPVLDFRRKLEVPEISARFELNDGANLFVIGTANPTGYGGTYDINEDLKSRFVEVEMTYPMPPAEKRILRAMAPEGFEFTQSAFDTLVNLAKETRQGAMHYMLSTRDLVQALHLVPRVGWTTVMFLMGQKFTGPDRALFLDRVRDITGETVPGYLPSVVP